MNGESGAPDYAGVIEDLEKKIEMMKQTVSQLRALAGLGAGPSPTGGGPSGGVLHDGTPAPVGRHEFVGRSTPEAVKMYLGKIKRLAGPREIAAALVAGGLGESEEAVYVNVYSALKRMRDTEVVKHRTEWGLAEQYPNLIGKGRPKKKGAVETETEDEAEEEVDLNELKPAGDTSAA